MGFIITVSQNKSLKLFIPEKRFINIILNIYRLRLL